MTHINCRCRQGESEVMSALSGPKQCLSTVNLSAILLCTMIFANPIPDGFVCASVLAALFLFIAMLDADSAGCLGKVRTLWIWTLTVNCKHDRHADDNTHCNLSRVFGGILHASRSYSPLFAGYVECWLFGGCCVVVVKRHRRYTQKPTTSHVRGCQIWSRRNFWGNARTVPWVNVKTEWMPIWRETSILSGIDLLTTMCRNVPVNGWTEATMCRVEPVNGWFKLSLLKCGVITLSPFFPVSRTPNHKTHTHKNTNKITTSTIGQWPERSRPHASQLGERPHTFILQQWLHAT